MRPTTVRVPQQLPRPLTRTFNQQAGESHQWYRAMGETPPPCRPPQYNTKRLAIMNRKFTLPSVSRGDCEGYLFHFLTDTPLSNEPTRGDPSIAMETNKRLQACKLYELLQHDETPQRLADVQREDPELVPTIILGMTRDSLPENATYDVVCSTDDPHAMAQLREGFEHSACTKRAIRGLRLEFGAIPVHPAPLKDITDGVAHQRQLSAIELQTDVANTEAETAVLRAIAGSSNIKQLCIEGRLAMGHSLGVITALSNASLENVEIKADEESCLRMLDWAADAGGTSGKNLRVELTMPFWHGAGAGKTEALATWNAAVVRLAESRTTKCLHLPREIKQGLTPETLKAAETAEMGIAGTGGWF